MRTLILLGLLELGSIAGYLYIGRQSPGATLIMHNSHYRMELYWVLPRLQPCLKLPLMQGGVSNIRKLVLLSALSQPMGHTIEGALIDNGQISRSVNHMLFCQLRLHPHWYCTRTDP